MTDATIISEGEDTTTIVGSSAFESIPIEVLRKIFSFLSFEDNLRARDVCTLWCDLVDENLSFNVPLGNETLGTVQLMNRPIKSLFVSNLTKEISFADSIRGNIGTKVDHLFLGRVSHPYPSISQDNLIALLTSLKEITSLTISPRSLDIKDLSLFTMISLGNVTKLEILVRRLSELETFKGILQLRLPSLQHLRLDWEKVYVSNVEKMMPLYEEMYAFVGRHKRMLRTLDLSMPYHWIDRHVPTTGDDRRSEILRTLPQVQLESVMLQGLPVEGSPVFNLGFHLLNHQKSLRALSLKDLKVGYYTRLRPLFLNSAGTLTELRMEGASMGASSYGPFSCQLLKPCLNLRKLTIHNPQISELTRIEDLPLGLEALSLKMPIDGRVVYSWIWSNLVDLKELGIRPTLWDSHAVVDINHFQHLLALPHLTKLTLSDGLFQSREILEFTQRTSGLTLNAASYSWPDLVNVYIHVDREVYSP
ncbi:unnamed protein product [Allacma fusca]|uniref:F-box domain-containing protein n=1 Tax=Allacma fusca TaxID=39272 RepID=A0A8J2KUN2_9HEXA|nr:unnamed protein product [Allacma fusca]